MARNIAKRFATMTLVYWAPNYGGSGVTYDSPVEFKGFYIGNTTLFGDEIGEIVNSVDSKNDNMVLFYLLKPQEQGFVSWEHTVAGLELEGMGEMAPSEIPNTHKLKGVTTLTMLRTKVPSIENQAYIASVE